MKTVIIYNHPYQGSFCHAILEATKRGIEEAGHTVDIIDLDKDNFNPVMTDQDLLAFRNHEMLDQQSKDYIKRVKQADHLVFIFPIWWELMPAMTKGFIDKVIFPGSAYNYTKSGYGMTTLLSNIKSTTVITTMNTPKMMYSTIYGNAISKAMIRGTLKKSGLKNVRWISFNQVKTSSESKRKKWLTRLEKNFSKK
ncbi:NAD(P)H-dependent oxidoreductase [Enterococcus mundtii]|uniref:NAD(P)H-dependent oxidoreductase n=1 Tax=Enterococcus TaxID=1350 RepID=UPI0008F1F8AB|nr:NAD(P)H-dependent oxidoreductase [Enterococcus mundtii]SFM33506.1 Putative NADPH-quinone reductase (modulator of drug activity B) [Enterococcus mundtii]